MPLEYGDFEHMEREEDLLYSRYGKSCTVTTDDPPFSLA